MLSPEEERECTYALNVHLCQVHGLNAGQETWGLSRIALPNA
jgi:hypothetical protein